MKKIDVASIEELLADICHHEDIESALIISTTKDKGAFVMGFDGIPSMSFSGDTFREALIAFGKASRERYEAKWFDEYAKLDWT